MLSIDHHAASFPRRGRGGDTHRDRRGLFSQPVVSHTSHIPSALCDKCSSTHATGREGEISYCEKLYSYYLPLFGHVPHRSGGGHGLFDWKKISAMRDYQSGCVRRLMRFASEFAADPRVYRRQSENIREAKCTKNEEGNLTDE